MMRLAKFIAAVALLPLVFAAVYAYGKFFMDFAAKSFPTYWSFWAGLLAYPFFHFFVGKPVKMYVIEHEMSHALFTLLSFGRIKKISIKKNNGSITVDKTNTIITLAPYFFPLYAVFIFALWKIVLYFYPLGAKYSPVSYAFIGSGLSFHFLMTVQSIFHGQSDLKSEGTVFSLVVIFLMYIMVSVFFLKLLFGENPSMIEIKVFFSDLKASAAVAYKSAYDFLIQLFDKVKR